MKPALAKARQVQAAEGTLASVKEVNDRLDRIEANQREILSRLEALSVEGGKPEKKDPRRG